MMGIVVTSVSQLAMASSATTQVAIRQYKTGYFVKAVLTILFLGLDVGVNTTAEHVVFPDSGVWWIYGFSMFVEDG